MALQYFDYSLSYQNQLMEALVQEEKTTAANIQATEQSIKATRKEINFLKENAEVEKTALRQFKEKLEKKQAYVCYFCDNKQFETDHALEEHYKRRHADEIPKPADVHQQTLLTVQTILLQQQLNQIIMAQQQQNLQLNQFQQAIYFQTMKITDVDTESESDEEPYMDEEQIIMQATIDQMKQEMVKREEYFQSKINQLESAIQDKLIDLSQSQIIEKKQQEDQEVIKRIDSLQKQIVDLQNQKQHILMPFNQEQLSIKTAEPEPKRSIIDSTPTPNIEIYPQNEKQPDFTKKIDKEDELLEQVQEEIEEPQHHSEIIEETQQEEQDHKAGHNEAEFYSQEKDFLSMVKGIKRRKQRNKKNEISEGEKQNFIDFKLEGKIADQFYKLLRTDISTLYKKQPSEIEEYIIKLGCKQYLNIEEKQEKPKTINIEKPPEQKSEQSIKQQSKQPQLEKKSIPQQEEQKSLSPEQVPETIFSKKKSPLIQKQQIQMQQSIHDSYDDFSEKSSPKGQKKSSPIMKQQPPQQQVKKAPVHSAIQKKQFIKPKLPGEEDSFDELADSYQGNQQQMNFDDDEFD